MSLVLSASIHQRSSINTPWAMRQVVIALIPVSGAAFFLFKEQAFLLLINCVISCVVSEAFILRIRKKPSQINDFSAVVTGLVLAFVLPPSTRWYAATIGSVTAIMVGKHLFGGLGQNIFNPALVGRAFLVAAYPKMLTSWVNPFSLDAVTSATPLALHKFDGVSTPLRELFIGTIPGSLGETSSFCLIIGGIYLLLRKVADWRIPLSYLLTVAIISSCYYFFDPAKGIPLFHLCSGGLLLGALFIATDPVTSPSTKSGRFIFGAGCGILTMIIRYFSGLPEGVMYAILFMNALTPLINRYTIPKPFGYVSGDTHR